MTNIFKNRIVQATLAILGVGVAFGAQTDKGGLLYDGISTSKVIEKYAQADNNLKVKFQLDGSAMKMPAPDKNSVGVVLGDKTKPDFEPKLELKRWDELAKLSVKPQGLDIIQKKDKDLILDGENIKFETPDIDYVFYDAPTSSDEGGFEYEIVLKNKPSTSTFYSEINSQGLEFYKQEALTQDEIDRGTQRPENVINSYAVYYSQNGDYTPMGGYNFRAGKFGHIYRIKAIDADGNWIWCDQNITPLTPNTSLWAKICDPNWIANAKLPIRIDPTIGYTSVGSSQSYIDSLNVLVCNHEEGNNGIVDSISLYNRNIYGNVNFKGVLVASSTKNIITDGISPSVLINSSAQWWTSNYVSKPTITNQGYYICWIEDGAGWTYGYFDSRDYWLKDTSNSYSSPSNPTDISILTTNNSRWSIYISYSETSSARPTSTYDANLPTSTFKAYKGASYVLAYNTSTGMWIDSGNNATSNPFPVNRAEWGIAGSHRGIEFTATEYGLVTSTNTKYATTTPSTTAGLMTPFLANINEFEVYATETPAISKNYIPYWIGRSNNITTTNASATNAMDDRLFMLNYCSNKWIEVDSNLNGSGTSTGSILTTTTFPWSTANKTCFTRPTTTSLGNRWQSNYAIFSPDIWTDCYNQASTSAKLLCYKMNETTTGWENQLSGVGCTYQSQGSLEDIWSQCTTTPNDITTGCGTGYCGQSAQTGQCGYYYDNAQHNCPTCWGCRSTDQATTSCEAKSTGWDDTPTYGCGYSGPGTECISCNNGSCDFNNCIGLQCGCNPGQICDASGVCQNESPPTCADICVGLGYTYGGCYNNISRCIRMPNGFVDGQSTDCTSPRFCCCHN